MPNKQIAFLGSRPKISLAEIEAVSQANQIGKTGKDLVYLNSPLKQPERLGGLIKLANVIKETDRQNYQKDITDYCLEQANTSATGKLTIALSIYGLDIKPQFRNELLLKIKQEIKSRQRSVRIILGKEMKLSSAQVLHNKLFKEMSFELSLCKLNGSLYVCRTIWVQNIGDYVARDTKRPKLNLKVGLSPPRLAQIMVNLASRSRTGIILDPFCGMGTILQEAILMGNDVIGSDISKEMIQASRENLDYLGRIHQTEYASKILSLEVKNALNHKWSPPPSFIVSEIDLGPSLTRLANRKTVGRLQSESDRLLENFLANVKKQYPGREIRLCLAVPSWRRANQKFVKLHYRQYVARLDYKLIRDDLTYFRPDQFVARQLLVLGTNNVI